jgi:integrase
MKERYRLFQNHARGGGYYLQDNVTRKQESLRTKDEITAKRLLQARNESHRVPAVNLQIARAYVTAADPTMVTRTWKEVMETVVTQKHGETQRRWSVAVKDEAYGLIRNKPLLETTSHDLLKVMTDGTVSTNVYLRRLHNFALDMDWLLKSIIPKRQWPKVIHGKKRAVTLEEHRRILERETNPERNAFYQLLWYLGGSQTDIATLSAEDIDWNDCTIGYERKKLEGRGQKPPLIHFGNEVALILRALPQRGPLFPYLFWVRPSDRATEFKQRCAGLKIHGVTLHSYRYAWAERARKCGYPQRFAQEALGHNSKAVHWAYAKKAEVKVPSLDAWESSFREKAISFPTPQVKGSTTVSEDERKSAVG